MSVPAAAAVPSVAPAREDVPTLRVCALYPELLNIYADRGNLLVLERRCAWRGLGFELQRASLGDAVDPEAHDLLYLGGGQDRDQALCAEDLATVKRDAVHGHAARGGAVLAVCGGYQLLGHGYELDGARLPGVGLLDLDTVRGDGRLIGDVAIEVDLPRPGGDPATRPGSRPDTDRDPGRVGGAGGAAADRSGDAAGGRSRAERVRGVLAGFENHGGRTRLGDAQRPLGRVLAGHGNTGDSGHEGAIDAGGAVVGTYLHGPLLPKNAWFADWLIATALGLEPEALTPLPDALEDAAHASARRAAGV